MTDTDTDTVTESDAKRRARWPLPANTQAILQLILDHGNASYTNAAGQQVAGTPTRPGPILPYPDIDIMAIAMNGLLAGERESFMTTRRGRHFARNGSLETFDDRLMDYDLAGWGQGRIDYWLGELTEAVEGYCHEIVLTRGEALIVLLKKGVVTAAEARRDV